MCPAQITKAVRFRRVLLVNCLVGVILILSAGVSVAVQSLNKAFAVSLPSADLCQTTIPAAFSGVSRLDAPPTAVYTLYPDDTSGDPLRYCDAAGATPERSPQFAFRLWHSEERVHAEPLAPDVVSLGCDPYRCLNFDASNACIATFVNATVPFAAGAMHGCYCRQLMESTTSIITGMMHVQSRAVCGRLLSGFGITQLGNLASGVVIVLFNVLLKAALAALTQYEGHLCISEQAHRLIVKSFAAQFMNTAIVSVVVQMQPPQALPDALKLLFIGDSSLFGRDWYVSAPSRVCTARSYTLLPRCLLQ